MDEGSATRTRHARVRPARGAGSPGARWDAASQNSRDASIYGRPGSVVRGSWPHPDAAASTESVAHAECLMKFHAAHLWRDLLKAAASAWSPQGILHALGRVREEPA
jgi:hypothetical protein